MNELAPNASAGTVDTSAPDLAEMTEREGERAAHVADRIFAAAVPVPSLVSRSRQEIHGHYRLRSNLWRRFWVGKRFWPQQPIVVGDGGYLDRPDW